MGGTLFAAPPPIVTCHCAWAPFSSSTLSGLRRKYLAVNPISVSLISLLHLSTVLPIHSFWNTVALLPGTCLSHRPGVVVHRLSLCSPQWATLWSTPPLLQPGLAQPAPNFAHRRPSLRQPSLHLKTPLELWRRWIRTTRKSLTTLVLGHPSTNTHSRLSHPPLLRDWLDVIIPCHDLHSWGMSPSLFLSLPSSNQPQQHYPYRNQPRSLSVPLGSLPRRPPRARCTSLSC